MLYYHNIISYYFISYHIISYYTILYYTILYYTILYFTILYYSILYCIILYYTILYYTILYCIILYRNIFFSHYIMSYYIIGTHLKMHYNCISTARQRILGLRHATDPATKSRSQRSVSQRSPGSRLHMPHLTVHQTLCISFLRVKNMFCFTCIIIDHHFIYIYVDTVYSNYF